MNDVTQYGFAAAITIYVIKECFSLVKYYRNGNKNGNGDRKMADREFQTSVVTRLEAQTTLLNAMSITVKATHEKAGRIEERVIIIKDRVARSE